MADGIPILLKRANYKDIHGDISSKVKDYYLKYGEPLFLKDLNYLVIGDGIHKVPYLVDTVHRYFQIAENAVFYGTATLYDIDIPLDDPAGHKVANLAYVKGYTNQELTNFLTNLISGFSVTGSAGKTITKIAYNTSTKKFEITFSDISIEKSQIKGWGDLSGTYTGAAGKTVTQVKQDNGKVTATFQDISISHNQVNDWSSALGSSTAGTAVNANNVNISTVGSGNYYVLGANGTGYKSPSYSSKNSPYFNAGTGVLVGAAWNDFAETRCCEGEPGMVVCEFGDGSLKPSTKRLQAGAAVISDTYGMVIGERKNGFQPIAVAGRVLVNYTGNIANYKPGDAVCAAPDGKIDLMSRREIRRYPDRILGYVSEIPTYEFWSEDIKVSNRIWVKIK